MIKKWQNTSAGICVKLVSSLRGGLGSTSKINKEVLKKKSNLINERCTDMSLVASVLYYPYAFLHPELLLEKSITNPLTGMFSKGHKKMIKKNPHYKKEEKNTCRDILIRMLARVKIETKNLKL